MLTTTAVVAYAGLGQIADFEDDAGIFGALASDALPSPLDKVVVLAVITSALSSTQTTILPASRTMLSMARQGAFPDAFGRVHDRFLTPHVSTIAIGTIAAVWFAVLFPLSARPRTSCSICRSGRCWWSRPDSSGAQPEGRPRDLTSLGSPAWRATT